jgi:preprotein translocase subunit SecD
MKVSAQSGAEPAELTQLRASWTRARDQATKPVDEKYTAALTALKERLTKAGNLEDALQVDKELKQVKGLPSESTPNSLEADNLAGASITISTQDSIKIITLRKGQPRLYDSNPLRVIEGIAPSVQGWKFTSIPQRLQNNYEVTVTAPGIVYAFGYDRTSAQDMFGADATKWQACQGPAHGINLKSTYQRKVAQGEVFRIQGFEISLAAKEITKSKRN